MNISKRWLTLASILITTAGLHAQVVTPNPAPTIIKTAPYTITQPGFYQLGADLTVSATSGSIITIAASNVTLDFAGHYISGPANTPASGLFGVYANEQGNLIIQNGTIAYCYVGVYLLGNGNSNSININQRVQNLLVSYCYQTGIALSGASNSLALNNSISFIGGTSTSNPIYAIQDYSGAGNRAVGNTITSVLATKGVNVAFAISGVSYAAGNVVNTVTNSGVAYNAYALYNCLFAVGNSVTNAYFGIYDCTKYANNLTSGCSTSFSGGTAAGYNN